jgi:hypothetical protein
MQSHDSADSCQDRCKIVMPIASNRARSAGRSSVAKINLAGLCSRIGGEEAGSGFPAPSDGIACSANPVPPTSNRAHVCPLSVYRMRLEHIAVELTHPSKVLDVEHRAFECHDFYRIRARSINSVDSWTGGWCAKSVSLINRLHGGDTMSECFATLQASCGRFGRSGDPC